MISVWLTERLGLSSRGLVTVAVMVLCALAVIGWDLWVVARRRAGERDTVSEITNRTARMHPLLPFAAGVLAGHLFWALEVCAPGCAP